MRSIWLPSYTTMKNSTPFTNMIGGGGAKSISASFPMTKDRVKTISTKPLTDQINSSLVKRKFETLDLDSQGSSNYFSPSSSSSSDQLSLDKENSSQEAKKSRIMTAFSNDSAQLLSQYSEATSVYFKQESNELTSSPVVIRVS